MSTADLVSFRYSAITPNNVTISYDHSSTQFRYSWKRWGPHKPPPSSSGETTATVTATTSLKFPSRLHSGSGVSLLKPGFYKQRSIACPACMGGSTQACHAVCVFWYFLRGIENFWPEAVRIHGSSSCCTLYMIKLSWQGRANLRKRICCFLPDTNLRSILSY